MRRKNQKIEATKSAGNLLLSMLLLAGCGGGSGSAAPTATVTRAVTSTATPPPSNTATPVPSATATTKTTATAVETATPIGSLTATATTVATATPIGSMTATATAVATATPVDTVTATATSADTATPTATETATPTNTPPPTATPTGVLPVAVAIARDANGVALHLNETVTTEGIVTVSAGVFANNKLKVFMQDGPDGIMVYHQSSADVDAFQAGDRLRATGVIIQKDPTSDANPANGTVAVNLTGGSWTVLSSGNPLPTPRAVDLATLEAMGNDYTGSLVEIANLQKVAGNWPAAGSKSTQVTVSDDGGTTTAILRFQKNTITQVMADKLTAIGDGAFDLVAIVVQDDPSSDGTLLSGYELWVRGAEDVQPAP